MTTICPSGTRHVENRPLPSQRPRQRACMGTTAQEILSLDVVPRGYDTDMPFTIIII
ncbi:hypothetical protein Pmar_PMAR009640 [Perkinsus marinus ATCC 50983]|uniref:Uncharacterized protein n=1 Tax=Perkinsus marinus (strain ATCC 50983 / TXsc) TaxID=423536 RepID=C5M023_PERM5|nr:hypothetical protein Pmar_PMAR009640 [Perkinsus marinus ATCC 50983]EEQ97681.1 hypothetical protein Pmar_PMAR009640 [Perkinsus marinus ATCC 50983]|eukprot:XP_002764964.1 hypothetical protein Pmar_PMAR009640 [Perkinsus marinus ATCC 50983]